MVFDDQDYRKEEENVRKMTATKYKYYNHEKHEEQ
jgi:hypothetical protein